MKALIIALYIVAAICSFLTLDLWMTNQFGFKLFALSFTGIVSGTLAQFINQNRKK